ncbi:ABC transporter ATP-binding protein [soil metagenome]
MGTQRQQVVALVRAHLTSLAGLARWRLLLAALLLIVTGAGEGVSLLLLVPLLQHVGLDPGAGTMGRIEAAMSSALASAGLPQTLAVVLTLYVAAATFQILLARHQAIFHIRLEQNIVRRLRQRLYRSIFSAGWLFLARQRSADLAHALTSELDRVGAATGQLASIAATVFMGGIYLGLALALSPAMTAMVLAAACLLLIALRGGSVRARAAGEDFSRASAGMYSAAIEHLAGIKTIKGQSREDHAVSLFTDVTDQLAGAHVRAAAANSWSKAWFDFGAVCVLALTLLVAIGTLRVPAATLLLLLFLFARIMPRLAALQQGVQQYLTLLPSVQAVAAWQERIDAASERDPLADPRPFSLAQGISFDAVSFGYGDRGAWALRNINLTLRAGQTIAIVGPSGAGKSTMADLLMGLLVPNEGIIAIDDEPLDRNRVRVWRDQIGYVAQDTFLLHDTIKANLLWADPAATDAGIDRALRLAAADGFVAACPEGLDTVIGDRGVQLSGGERQRLALARALLRKPALLILDEATSSLDSGNEQRIQQAIERLHGSMTIVVIAHRLSTIRGADMIHVLEHGRLVESGNWDTLVALGGRFAQLCTTQNAAGSPLPASAGLLRA